MTQSIIRFEHVTKKYGEKRMDKSSIRRTYKDFDDYDNRGYDTYDDDDEYRR